MLANSTTLKASPRNRHTSCSERLGSVAILSCIERSYKLPFACETWLEGHGSRSTLVIRDWDKRSFTHAISQCPWLGSDFAKSTHYYEGSELRLRWAAQGRTSTSNSVFKRSTLKLCRDPMSLHIRRFRASSLIPSFGKVPRSALVTNHGAFTSTFLYAKKVYTQWYQLHCSIAESHWHLPP
jgi:hypothetical protein